MIMILSNKSTNIMKYSKGKIEGLLRIYIKIASYVFYIFFFTYSRLKIKDLATIPIQLYLNSNSNMLPLSKNSGYKNGNILWMM
jgi:hypothetical protein